MSQVIPLHMKIVNVFLIKGEKSILVDTGSPKDTLLLPKAIKDAGVNLQDISLIIHTHAHFDHCGCTADLKEKSVQMWQSTREMLRLFQRGEIQPLVQSI